MAGGGAGLNGEGVRGGRTTPTRTTDTPAAPERRPAALTVLAALRRLMPLLLLTLLWFVVDVPAALARLADTDLRWLLVGLALVQVQIVVSALRWRVTAARLGQRIGLGRAVREYYVATLLNQTLPGGVAGDAARVYRNRETAGRAADAGGAGRRSDARDPSSSSDTSRSADDRAAVTSDSLDGRHAVDGAVDRAEPVAAARVARGVVLERLAGQVSLVAATLVGVAIWPLLLDAPPPSAVPIAVGTTLAIALALVALTVVLTRHGPPRLARFAASVRPAIVQCWFRDGMWLVQGVTSVAVTAAYVGSFVAAAHAVGAPLPPAGVLTAVPLALLSMLLPLSVGGWGMRETAVAALWPAIGLSAESGVAASVVYGLVSLAGSLPAVVFVWRARRTRASGCRSGRRDRSASGRSSVKSTAPRR